MALWTPHPHDTHGMARGGASPADALICAAACDMDGVRDEEGDDPGDDDGFFRREGDEMLASGLLFIDTCAVGGGANTGNTRG